jgi:uncharacterized repeat protein (TIGR03803 family)
LSACGNGDKAVPVAPSNDAPTLQSVNAVRAAPSVGAQIAQTERIVYSFKGATEGAFPCENMAGLIEVNGVLYGTTSSGGAHAAGTAFAVTTSGAERLLYSF